MKKGLCCLLLAAAGVASGCLPMPLHESADGNNAQAPAPPVRMTPPVRAEQVNEANAREKGEALREELEQDARRDAGRSEPR